MAYVPKDEMSLKIKALTYGLKKLIDESTPINNRVTNQNITDDANKSIWGKQLLEPMTIETIKQSTNEEIQKLRAEKRKHDINMRNAKTMATDTTSTKINDLTEKVASLTSSVALLLDEGQKKDKKIDSLTKGNEKTKKERDGYILKIKEMES